MVGEMRGDTSDAVMVGVMFRWWWRTEIMVEEEQPKQRSAAAATQEAARVAAVNAARESARVAELDRQNRNAAAEAAAKARAEAAKAPISGGESMARFGTPVYAGTTTKVADDMISQGEGQMDAKEKFISQQYIKPLIYMAMQILRDKKKLTI